MERVEPVPSEAQKIIDRSVRIFAEKQMDRYKGAMFGLAVGDALGTTLEFKSPGTFDPISDIVGGGPFHLKPGQWTDDTSMALCLAESLIECKGFSPEDQLKRYVDWWANGHLSSTGECFDCGNTTASSLGDFVQTGRPYSTDTNEQRAGNGSIMRLAPIPLFYARSPADAVAYAAASSRTTHAAATCLDACRLLADLIVGALAGTPKEKLFRPDYYLSRSFSSRDLANHWLGSLHPEILAIAKGSFKTNNPPYIAGTGHVVKSLEAALWCIHNTDTFRDAVLLAANLGDDADTTAAVCGQLAGAIYGLDGIPSEWVEKIAMRDVIDDYSARLFAGRA